MIGFGPLWYWSLLKNGLYTSPLINHGEIYSIDTNDKSINFEPCISKTRMNDTENQVSWVGVKANFNFRVGIGGCLIR